jgi:hypothetical protein
VGLFLPINRGGDINRRKISYWKEVKKMQLLPTKGKDLKLFLISLIAAFILNAGRILRIGSIAGVIAFIIDILIYAVLIMVLLRVIDWVLTKFVKK